jgi:hypothetical protein
MSEEPNDKTSADGKERCGKNPRPRFASPCMLPKGHDGECAHPIDDKFFECLDDMLICRPPRK